MQLMPYSFSNIPTLPHILQQRAQQLGDTPYLYVDGKHVLSWQAFADAVFNLALGLREQGLQPGERVAILSDNSVDWLIAQLAIFASGLISAPLLPAHSDAMLQRILQHAQPRALLVDAALMTRVLALPQDSAVPAFIAVMNGTYAGFPTLRSLSIPASAADIAQLLQGIHARMPASLAYTSGSTGEPKGVLKHQAASVVNHGFCDNAGQLVMAQPEQTAGLILSLNHGLGQALFNRSLVRGYALAMTAKPEAEIGLADVAALQASILWVVPRVIKRLVEEFDTTNPEWVQTYETQLAAGQAGETMAALRGTMQQAFGGKLTQVHSAGSPTPPALLKRFAALQLPLYEFYGSTESGTITVGSAGGVPGMTGLPLPGIEVRLDTDGELLVRGPGVSLGYYRDPQATAAIIDAEGWCRTGDLAIIKPEGLHITGRKKDIFNTSEGSNIYPSRLEAALEELPLIAEAVLLADRRPFIDALLVIATAKAQQQLGRLLQATDYADASELHQAVMQAIAQLNQLLEPYERVNKVTLLATPFSPTLRTQVGGVRKTRVRRDLIEQWYAEEIEQLYVTA